MPGTEPASAQLLFIGKGPVCTQQYAPVKQEILRSPHTYGSGRCIRASGALFFDVKMPGARSVPTRENRRCQRQ